MKYFGTDGIRGIFSPNINQKSTGFCTSEASGCTKNEIITEELAFLTGAAFARFYLCPCVIGMDTRLSSPLIKTALINGFLYQSKGIQSIENGKKQSFTQSIENGQNQSFTQSVFKSKANPPAIKVFDIGITPSPSIELFSKSPDHPLGIMITASHNPPNHNGIKLFFNGEKPPKAVEMAIESIIDNIKANLSKGNNLVNNNIANINLANDNLTNNNIANINLANDNLTNNNTKNDNLTINNSTNDNLINESINNNLSYKSIYNNLANFGQNIIKTSKKSTYIDYLVKDMGRLNGVKIYLDCGYGAAGGVAAEVFSRLGAIVTCENFANEGSLINVNCGALYPQNLQKKGFDFAFSFDGDADRLSAAFKGRVIDGDSVLFNLSNLFLGNVVSTIMSNTALKRAIESRGRQLLLTDVGDKNVFNKIKESGSMLGGEPSGHYIFYPRCSTGDGILAALMLIKSCNNAPEFLELDPQKTVSITAPAHAILCKEFLAIKGKHSPLLSRLVVRPSGTEPKIRITAMASEDYLVENAITELSEYLYSY